MLNQDFEYLDRKKGPSRVTESMNGPFGKTRIDVAKIYFAHLGKLGKAFPTFPTFPRYCPGAAE